MLTAAAAVAFLIVHPPVGDIWAAEARRSAVLHGVGLDYWFSWFGGLVPGNYSVLTPYLFRIVDVSVLGAAATVLSVLLCWLLLRSTPHRTAAAWFASLGSAFSLWSGRIPFAVGTVAMLVALLAVRSNRKRVAAVAGAATALISPVSGVFLILGVCGVVVHDRQRRACAIWASIAAGACLVAVALYFGMPGSEGFPLIQAALAAVALLLMLLARPPAQVRTVVLVALAACPVLAFVPNGMGTNFERFTWICLPVAVVATGRAPRRGAFLAAGTALAMGIVGSLYDLYVAAQPMSAPSYSAGLVAKIDGLPGLANYRVEVIPDGTHVAAYALLGHASLARGYETQADNALDAVLMSSKLDARSYRTWLAENAVKYVALDRRTLRGNPEERLVRHHRPHYLRQVWSDSHWVLYAVARPAPLIAAPARVTAANQASLVVSVPRPGRYSLRVHWSRFLGVKSADAALEQDGSGWSVLVADAPGSYQISG
jgi:hypothetical protein